MKASDFLDAPSASSFLDEPVKDAEGGAAFGIYPRQRATPSKPETKEAVKEASETAAKGLETLGFFPPTEEKKFDVGRVGASTALGAGAGAVGPKVLQAAGRGMQYIPAAPAKVAGKGVEALGRALGTTPALQRTVGGATTFGAADVGGQLAEKAGLPAVVGMGAGVKAKDIGEALGTKLKGVTSVLRAPEPVGEATGLKEVGSKLSSNLKTKAASEYEKRRGEAETNYEAALDAAREKQGKGAPFATSPQGQALLQSLERDKYEVVNGKLFLKGEEQVKGIDRLINAIKGETTGGETVPVGKGKITSQMTKKLPSKTTQKDIDALIEELRFLRDVDAKGKSYEAYAGLSARYKRDLINKFERALYDWNPEYEAADAAYKEASARLLPFRTRLLEGALKGEKFDPSDLVTSVEKFPQKFFADSDTVAQLKQVTNDPAFVATTAKEYVATLFDNKTPQQIKGFVQDPKNQGWLREAGIYDDVARYADRATTIENRKDILKKLGLYSAAAVIGTTAASKIGSLF